MTYDIGNAVGQSDGTEQDIALSTEENSLNNAQISKIGGLVLASVLLGGIAMFAYKKYM